MRARLVPACVLALLAWSCAACSVFDRTPEPVDAAGAAAEGLADGSVSEAFGSAGAQGAYDEIVAGLAEQSTPQVVVRRAEVAGEGEIDAVATLQWTWPLGDDAWSYQTELALRLVEDAWEPVWDPTVVESSLVDGEVLAITEVGAARGRIVGARGRVIVGPRPVVRFGIDRGQVGPGPAARRSARQLARLVGVDSAPYAARVVAAGERAFVEAIVFRQEQVPPRVATEYRGIPGALAVPAELPLAPTREFAAPILGSVGEVTAEILQEHAEVYEVGDLVGLSGLQARYEERLRGSPGLVVEAAAADGSGEERELFRIEPEAGEDLEVALDVGLQRTAEAVLANVGPASALVAIRPSDGAILAAANGPGSDGYNIATFGQYAPGSTMKIVSSLALLRSGLTPGSSVECPSTVVVDGREFGNYDDYPSSGIGMIALRTALANSCNTAFINGRSELARGDLAAAAGSLGLGVDHDIGFPSYFGQVPPPASQTEAAADMIGQGRVLASPMGMATVMASVMKGSTVVPRLVEGVTSDVPDVVPLRPREVRDLRSMLADVVTVGSAIQLADLPPPPVLAKTGTAEFGTDVPLRTHAWMVAGRGDLAVAVFVERGESGSRTAGPILEAFLRAAR